MAKAIATVGGVAILPGVSLNRRWYTREALAAAVTKAQERLALGESIPLRDSFGQAKHPLTTRTHHGSEDDSTRIAGRVVSLSLGENGEVRYTAEIADTAAGRDIAALVDTSDGKPAFLRGVSIRGAWDGPVRRVTAPDGKPAETAPGLTLDGLDYTASPGVPGAGIDTFAWASDGQQETTERVLITESVQEAHVTISEGIAGEGAPESFTPAIPGAVIPAVPDGVREAVRAVFAPAEAHVLDNGLCATCGDVEEAKRTRNTKPYGDVTYADNGYQKDKVKRYPLDTTAHIRAAWSYINMPKNAAKYDPGALRRIKSRIKAALKRTGAKVTAESDVVAGFVVGEAVQAPAVVLEWLGDDPKRSGSWSVSACNGPVNLNISSYCMAPADLDVIVRAAADAACTALKRLDPDMDGDVDVPGADSGDTDHDGGHETAPAGENPADESTEPASAGETGPAPAGTEEGDPAMAEETTTTGTGGATLTLSQVQETAATAAAAAVTAAFEARDKAKADAKAARKAAEAREAEQRRQQKAALGDLLTEMGMAVPATEGAPAAATAATEGTGGGSAPLTEADVERMAGDMFRQFVQEAHASGAILPARAGLVVREHAIPDADNAPDGEALRKMSDDDLMNHMGGAMAQQADLIRPVGAQA